jgi:hypothetical protein
MGGGLRHEHIIQIWWEKIVDGRATSETGISSRADMVAYIEKHGNEVVWCPDMVPGRQGAWVHVNSNGHVKYVQTVADGRWTDNLLSLPDR